VIAATRKFVCIRIDSYGSEENQKIVRSYLEGRFENTAFCILAPDGKERLTRSGRGPGQIFGRRGNLSSELDKISEEYRVKKTKTPAEMPNFGTFRMALNIASGDQRVLVLQAGESKEASKNLSAAAWSSAMIGRFHYDLEKDAALWSKVIEGEKSTKGIIIINPDPFGQKGSVMAQLPLAASRQEIAKAMSEANATFAKTTAKKTYSEHVEAGRRAGVYFEMPVEFGEDRDGDGVIDHRPGKGRRGEGRRGEGRRGEGRGK